MDPRSGARALAFGRIAIGAALLLFPRLVGRLLLGRDGATPAASVTGRAVGVRDVVLGGMVLHTIDSPQVAPRWLNATAVCDTVDSLAALAALRGIPRARGLAFAAVAAGGAAGAATFAKQIAASEGGDEAPSEQPAPAGVGDAPEQDAPSGAVMPDGAEANLGMGARTVGGGPAHGGGVGSGTGSGAAPGAA